jgi:hypothetical protein
MVFKTPLILLFLALISSCAQVGFLTGGDEDSVAPEPSRSIPENGTFSFTGNRVKLSFDEFVQLKDPQQNIFMIPNDAKIETSLVKKDLILTWSEPLKPNTTYVIYLNEAIADVSEGNSTLLRYVFATGDVIDTLRRTFRVVNAETNLVEQKTTVGLFTENDSLKPLYFCMTDMLGFASFEYLKEGNYFVRAFHDENKDLQIGASESRGFLEAPIKISPSETDTINVRLFAPKPTRFISRFEFKAPGILEAELTPPLKDPLFKLNGVLLDSMQLRKVSDVLYRIIPSDSISQYNNLHLIAENASDSSSIRVSSKERITPMIISLVSSSVIPLDQPLIYQINNKIHTVDTSKIHIYPSKDSLLSIPFRPEHKRDVLFLWPEIKDGGTFTIQFDEGAIEQLSRPFQSTFEIKEKKDLGTLLIDLEGFNGLLLVELLKNKKVEQKRSINSSDNILFEDLIPGEYTIRVTEDNNGNGRWDTGDLYRQIQPERIKSYDNPIRIRPNWDLKLSIKADK